MSEPNPVPDPNSGFPPDDNGLSPDDYESMEFRALISALKAIDDEEDLLWIRKSSVLERAFLTGLHRGLRGISSSEHMLWFILRTTMLRTMYARTGDDWFHSTNAATILDSLERNLRGDQVYRTEATRNITELEGEIARLDTRYQQFLNQVRLTLKDLVDELSKNDVDAEQEKIQSHIKDLPFLLKTLFRTEIDFGRWWPAVRPPMNTD